MTDPALDVPEPPWLRTKPRRTRAPLSRDAIVDGALRVLDCEGASGLSMRRIAEELGCGTSAIYWHVANKEQLIQLVFDRVIAEVPLPEVEPARWQEQVKQAARDVRGALQRHPGIARLAFGTIPLGPNALRYHEWHLSVLLAGGLPDQAAALAGDLIHLWVYAFGFEECLGLPVPVGGGEEFVGAMRAYLASLPPERFPNTSGLAEQITTPGRDERFEFGLEIMVGGLAAQARAAGDEL